MKTMVKHNKSICLLMFVALLVMLMSFSISVYADDLNGVGDLNKVGSETETQTTTNTNEVPVTTNQGTTNQGTTNTNSGTTNPLPPTSPETQKNAEDTAKAIGDLFSGAGPDAESINEANEFLRPFAVIMNKLMAIILGITSLLMMLVTVLDLLYMAFPPVRDMLDGGMAGGQMQGGRGSRGTGMRRGMGMGMGGYGMGGYGMGMGGMSGGMGMGGMGMDGMGGMSGGMSNSRNQQAGGGLSAIGRWVSDEAIAACLEAGGGPMAGMNGQQQGPIKSMLFSYMKKRSMFLILFGVCVILFTSTAFTDLGVKVGTWLLRVIMGFGN